MTPEEIQAITDKYYVKEIDADIHRLGLTPTTGPYCCAKAVRGYGNTEYGVVIIGIAPANQEIKEGRPFQGQNGKLMDSVMRYVGWDRSKVYCTNLICHPIKDTDPDLTIPEFTSCLQRLEQELVQANPRLVIPVGSAATKYFTGMGVGKARGVPVFNKRRGYYVMPSYQPVAALQGDPSVIHHLVRDFGKISTILEWPQDGSIKDVEYTVVSSAQQAQSVLYAIEPGTLVSLDIETDSEFVNVIDIHRDRLLCLAISYFGSTDGTQHTFVFPRDTLDNLRWPTNIRYGYQNGPFDQKGMSKYLGVDLPIDEDTLVMSYALDERGGRDEVHDSYGGIHGLGPQADEFCGAEFYKDKMKPGHKRPAELDEHDLYKYNAYDAGYTLRLLHKYIPMLHSQGTWGLYHDRLLPLDRAFAEINYQGVSVDRKRLQDLILDWGPRFLKGEEYLQELASEHGFPGQINLNSPKQLSRFLYDILGLDGGPSTARNIIEELDHPFVDALLAHKRLDHIWKHYIIPGTRSIKMDGRVHPNTLIHGTTSGRLAYVDPPLQTLPQDYTVGEYAEIRSIYIPESTDYVIMEFDYAQIEIWIAAGLSQDQHMLEALAGGDYHSATARDVMRLPIDTMDPADKKFTRQMAKKVGFGVIYDIGATTLAKPKTGINSSVAYAQQVIDTFYEVNWQYRDWTKATIQRARTDGELVNPFGRHRRFRLFVDKKQERQAINFPVQSIANDYTLSALLELHFGLTLAQIAQDCPRPTQTKLQQLGARILFGVHDSIVMQVHKSNLLETIEYVKSVMEQQWLSDMPAGHVEPKIGPNLYNVTELSTKYDPALWCGHESKYYGKSKCLSCLVKSFRPELVTA